MYLVLMPVLVALSKTNPSYFLQFALCSVDRGRNIRDIGKKHRAAAAELNLMGNRKTILATTG